MEIMEKFTVVIKPNPGHPGPREKSSSTSPEAVAMIKEVRKAKKRAAPVVNRNRPVSLFSYWPN